MTGPYRLGLEPWTHIGIWSPLCLFYCTLVLTTIQSGLELGYAKPQLVLIRLSDHKLSAIPRSSGQNEAYTLPASPWKKRLFTTICNQDWTWNWWEVHGLIALQILIWVCVLASWKLNYIFRLRLKPSLHRKLIHRQSLNSFPYILCASFSPFSNLLTYFSVSLKVTSC